MGMKDLNQIEGRSYCTYPEAIMLMHRLLYVEEGSALPTPLQCASVVAAIYGRETVTTFDHIKEGMV